ncbi:MAG: SDR family oxidoreductase [Planctomycetota bacterium]
MQQSNDTRPFVIITGASQGIGRAISLAFAREGAHVLLTSRSRDRLESVAREVQQNGGAATVVAADVARPSGAQTILEAAAKIKNSVDVLVNNAGVFRVVPFLETDIDKDWNDVIATNLTGTFLPTLKLMPMLLGAPRPHLMNILSIAALRGYPQNAGYTASKWGVRGMTESLRAEFSDKLRITSVYPGATDTDIWNGIPFPYHREKMLTTAQIAEAVIGAWKAKVAPPEIILESPEGAVG